MTMEGATTATDAGTSAPQPLIDTDIPANPAPAADEQKTDTPAPGAEEKTETPEQQEAKKESRRQRAARRDRDAVVAAQTEARLLREQLAARDKQAAPAVEGEPKRENFEDYESYLRAVTKYDAKQEAAAALEADRKANQGKETQTKQATEQQALAESWGKREAAVIKANPDYEEAVTPYVEEDLGQLSDGARRLIVDSDVGPQVLHHLATHADVHDRIAKLSPLRQIVELGKLEDSLAPKGEPDPKAEEEAEPVKAEGKKISTAPAPTRPSTGGKSAPTGYSEQMSSKEYAEWKAQQMKH